MTAAVPRGSQAGLPPIDGLRVLDLTRVWSGPLATRILGDLGAQVVRIERPAARGPAGTGRGVGAPGVLPGPDPWNLVGMQNKLHRNKLGLTLDLAMQEGHELFCRLVRDADVVIENYSPRVMGNLRLGYDTLAGINPRIIMVSMPGYGLDGPLRDRVAYGTSLDAESGLATLMGYPDRGPQRTGVTLPDLVAALHAAGAVLTALMQREETGRGQHVDLSQFESMVQFVADQVVGWQLTGERPRRIGNRHRWMAPHGLYACLGADRWLSISVASDEQWRSLAGIIGRADLARDSRFATIMGRQRHQDELDVILTQWTVTQSAHEAMLLLQGGGIAAGEVLSAQGMFEDPHLRARDFFISLDHPSAGRHDYPGLPMRFSETAPVFKTDAPRLGEHNREILQGWLGYDDQALERLEAAGVIAQRPPG